MIRELFKRAFEASQGRHNFLVLSFFVSGNILHWFHRLDGTYIGYMSTLMGFLLGRTVSQDITSMPPTLPPPAALPAPAPFVQIQTAPVGDPLPQAAEVAPQIIQGPTAE